MIIVSKQKIIDIIKYCATIVLKYIKGRHTICQLKRKLLLRRNPQAKKRSNYARKKEGNA